ncbi:hypothetical protein COCNU_scaffold011954G000020 [Cocos nucifera]|nr:hypothetical protein [Cocos nucifera]
MKRKAPTEIGGGSKKCPRGRESGQGLEEVAVVWGSQPKARRDGRQSGTRGCRRWSGAHNQRLKEMRGERALGEIAGGSGRWEVVQGLVFGGSGRWPEAHSQRFGETEGDRRLGEVVRGSGGGRWPQAHGQMFGEVGGGRGLGEAIKGLGGGRWEVAGGLQSKARASGRQLGAQGGHRHGGMQAQGHEIRLTTLGPVGLRRPQAWRDMDSGPWDARGTGMGGMGD